MPHENAVKSAILRPWKRITFKKILTLTWQWSLPKWRSLLSMIPWKVIIYYGGCKSVSYNQKHIISWRFWPLPASSQVISKHLYSHLLHQKTVPLTILNFSTKTVDSVFYMLWLGISSAIYWFTFRLQAMSNWRSYELNGFSVCYCNK